MSDRLAGGHWSVFVFLASEPEHAATLVLLAGLLLRLLEQRMLLARRLVEER